MCDYDDDNKLVLMDIFQQQSMQNWKKQIIMDPHLNCLFDNNLSAEEFLSAKILNLTNQQIVKVYMKLGTLKHSISKNMQKEIEIRYMKIQTSFQQNYETKNIYQAIDHNNLKNNLKNIQKFNQKYQLINQKVIEGKNINKILHFAKALQKFKVSIRILKSLMKDYDQNSKHKLLGELVNSLKISKILKQISAITIKFDFTGIQSYQNQRGFINHSKGAIFGLIQKELTLLLNKIPEQVNNKSRDIEKQIISKFVILGNINKLKDFCIPYFKNNLKEMSELLKKSLLIGQVSEERDPKNYLTVFEQYFVNTIHKKLVGNSIIFIVLQQMLQKNNIKLSFIPNFFDKYWENVIGFIRDMVTWSIDTDSKDWVKQKCQQNLIQAFVVLNAKGQMNRYLTSIIWKYPILYSELTSIANQIHIFLINNSKYHHYEFCLQKQKLMKEIIPLSQLYYRHVQIFVDVWKNSVITKAAALSADDYDKEHYPVCMVAQLLQESSRTSLTLIGRIMDWLMFNLRCQQIYQYFVHQIVAVTDLSYSYFKVIVGSFDASKHKLYDFGQFIHKCQIFFERIKCWLKRGSNYSEGTKICSIPSRSDINKGVLMTDSSQLVVLINKYRKYKTFLLQHAKTFQIQRQS